MYIIIRDDICKKCPLYTLSSSCNLCVDMNEDGLGIDRNMCYMHVQALNDYIEIKLCQAKYVNTVTI